MFTIKKTILSIAAVASSVILLSSCGSPEIVQPTTLASELGVAKVTGKFIVNTNEANDLVTFTGLSVPTIINTTIPAIASVAGIAQTTVNGVVVPAVPSVAGVAQSVVTSAGTGFATTVVGVKSYENNFPAGLKLYITYMQASVNPVRADPSSPADQLQKSLTVPVAADGSYSFDIPASGKGTEITISVATFEADVIIPFTSTVAGASLDSKGTITSKYSFAVENWAWTNKKVFVGDNVLPLGVFVRKTAL